MISFKDHKAFFFTSETITRNESLVMFYLYSYMSHKNTTAHPGMTRISSHCKLPLEISITVIHSLEKKRFIKITNFKPSTGKAQLYTLSMP